MEESSPGQKIWQQVHVHDLYIRHLMTRCQVKVVHLRQEIQTSQKQKQKTKKQKN